MTETTPKVPGVVRKGGPSVCVPELRRASTSISPFRGYSESPDPVMSGRGALFDT